MLQWLCVVKASTRAAGKCEEGHAPAFGTLRRCLWAETEPHKETRDLGEELKLSMFVEQTEGEGRHSTMYKEYKLRCMFSNLAMPDL